MKKAITFAMVSCAFALGVYLAHMVEWDRHLPTPSYGQLLDNIQSETAKTKEWNKRQFCAAKPHHEACR